MPAWPEYPSSPGPQAAASLRSYRSILWRLGGLPRSVRSGLHHSCGAHQYCGIPRGTFTALGQVQGSLPHPCCPTPPCCGASTCHAVWLALLQCTHWSRTAAFSSYPAPPPLPPFLPAHGLHVEWRGSAASYLATTSASPSMGALCLPARPRSLPSPSLPPPRSVSPEYGRTPGPGGGLFRKIVGADSSAHRTRHSGAALLVLPDDVARVAWLRHPAQLYVVFRHFGLAPLAQRDPRDAADVYDNGSPP